MDYASSAGAASSAFTSASAGASSLVATGNAATATGSLGGSFFVGGSIGLLCLALFKALGHGGYYGVEDELDRLGCVVVGRGLRSQRCWGWSWYLP